MGPAPETATKCSCRFGSHHIKHDVQPDGSSERYAFSVDLPRALSSGSSASGTAARAAPACSASNAVRDAAAQAAIRSCADTSHPIGRNRCWVMDRGGGRSEVCRFSRDRLGDVIGPEQSYTHLHVPPKTCSPRASRRPRLSVVPPDEAVARAMGRHPRRARPIRKVRSAQTAHRTCRILTLPPI